MCCSLTDFTSCLHDCIEITCWQNDKTQTFSKGYEDPKLMLLKHLIFEMLNNSFHLIHIFALADRWIRPWMKWRDVCFFFSSGNIKSPFTGIHWMSLFAMELRSQSFLWESFYRKLKPNLRAVIVPITQKCWSYHTKVLHMTIRKESCCGQLQTESKCQPSKCETEIEMT